MPQDNEGDCSHFSSLAKPLKVRRHMGYAHNSGYKTTLKSTASNSKYYDFSS